MNLIPTIVPLLILVLLLLLQIRDHVLDHLLERLELVPVDSGVRPRHQKRENTPSRLRQSRNQLLDRDASSIVHLCGDLHERRRGRQRLLEQMEGVIVIEHLHGIGDGLQLHHVVVLAGLVLRSSLLASTLCFHQQVLIGLQSRLCRSDVGLRVGLLLSLTCQLGLLLIQLSLGVTDFLALRTHQIIVRLSCCVLILGHRFQIAFHIITHLVQDTEHLRRSTHGGGLRRLVQLGHVVFRVRRHHRGDPRAQSLEE
mmetsp:Transcript_34619/g.83569  ORF Transcript_34619/g.83569 Transcript_34619/m.83569 type:complete len:255 (+) Transcript_34619:1030-1794(+)